MKTKRGTAHRGQGHAMRRAAARTLAEQAKATKVDARYTPHGTRQEHCGICKHFIQPGRCEVIEGEVVPGGWCRFFSKLGSGNE